MNPQQSSVSGPRVAVVTSAGSGIGRELALVCAQRGMTVVGADIEASALAEAEAMLHALGTPCRMLRCEVTRAAYLERIAQAATDEFGGTDWLFNSAGVATLDPVREAIQGRLNVESSWPRCATPNHWASTRLLN